MPATFQIALDGPVAVGKSTIARLLAQRLGMLYVDTGAMYRAAAYVAVRNSVDPNDANAVATLLQEHRIDLATPHKDQEDGRKITVYLDGEDVSWAIRTEEVSTASSIVAQHAAVRALLVEQQQAIAAEKDVVMEGRDITFRVLPQAQLKIFLTANDATRAEWRHAELLQRGQDITFEQVLHELEDRDRRDRERAVDPLHVTEDAWFFDRSSFTLEETLDAIEQRAREIWPNLPSPPKADK